MNEKSIRIFYFSSDYYVLYIKEEEKEHKELKNTDYSKHKTLIS